MTCVSVGTDSEYILRSYRDCGGRSWDLDVGKIANQADLPQIIMYVLGAPALTVGIWCLALGGLYSVVSGNRGQRNQVGTKDRELGAPL